MAVAANLVALVFVVFITFIVVKGQWLVDFDEENYDYGEGDPFKFDFGEEEEEEEKKEEKPCAPPPDIRNGQTRVWGGGLLLEYICNSTYYAVGPTHGACDLATGQWTINPPLCVESKCPSLVAPNRGVVNMDVTGGVATFTCRQGFYLIGSRVLLCEGGKWTGIYPVCVVNPKLTTTTPSPPVVSKGDVSKGDVIKTLVTTATPVTEDLSFVNSDETCFHGHVEPPALENAVVEISYVMNEARGRYVMVATYTCFAGHKLLNQTANKLFCKDHKWGASITPQCVSENDPCALNNGECEHICVPSDTTYQCTCSHGYTLQSDGKKCEDVDECVIDNGGCQQECHNTHASYFCSCYQGYAANGPTCIGPFLEVPSFERQ